MNPTSATAHARMQNPVAPVGVSRAGREGIAVGTVFVRLDGVTGYRVEERNEEGARLGNIIMVNLFVGAAVAFLLGILSDYLTTRFYLAVMLFGLLAFAALDDLLRSRSLVLWRLFLHGPNGETLVMVTPDERAVRTVAAELDRRQVPQAG